MDKESAKTQDKPTVVLVHGAHAGSNGSTAAPQLY